MRRALPDHLVLDLRGREPIGLGAPVLVFGAAREPVEMGDDVDGRGREAREGFERRRVDELEARGIEGIRV